MKTEYFSLAVKNLRHRKLRSWLTGIGILISIATIFVLISVSLGLNQAVEEQFAKLGTDKLFIEAKGRLTSAGGEGAVKLTTDDVEKVEKVNGVKEAYYLVIATAKVEFADKTRYVIATGMQPEAIETFLEAFTDPLEGEPIANGETGKVMLGAQYKLNNIFDRPVEVGDKIKVNEVIFRVKTILSPTGSPPDDQQVIFNVEDFKEIFPETGNRADTIFVQVSPGEDVNEVAQRIEKELRKFRNVKEENQDFKISTPEELLETFGTVLNILTGFLIGIGAISLVVGGIGIANTMFTSVIERTKEIGIMKAVGARNSDILLIFVTEAGLLGLVGGAAGIILGVGIAKIIEIIAVSMLGTELLRAAFPLYLVLGCLFFSFVVGAVSGLMPAWHASKIKPVVALRYE